MSKDDADADNDCYTDGKIAHELLHAYGLYHEHLRPDRSDYIQINYNNIRDYSKNVVKFKKMAHLPTYGVLYDGRSLMHYSSMYLSNGNGPTMISVNFPEMSVVLLESWFPGSGTHSCYDHFQPGLTCFILFDQFNNYH